MVISLTSTLINAHYNIPRSLYHFKKKDTGTGINNRRGTLDGLFSWASLHESAEHYVRSV